MLYHLLFEQLAGNFSALNVFRYLTFRSVGSALTALLIAFIVGPALIKWLENRQVGQTIRDDPPERHQEKAGTPTMGGVLILLAVLTSTLLWAEWTNPYVWIVLGVTVGCGLLGFADDYTKAVRKKPEGIRALTKLLWQIAIACVAMIVLFRLPGFDAQISLPLVKDFHPSIGWAYVPLAAVFIVGFSNAVNLTDGLDGLAIGPTMITAGVIGLFAYVVGNSVIASYLELKYVPGVGTLAIILHRADRRRARLLVVQRLPRFPDHGRHRRPRAGRSTQHRSRHHPPGGRAGHRRWDLLARDVLRHRAGGLVQAASAARLPYGADPPSLRAPGLAGATDHRPLLDHLGDPGAHCRLHVEAPMSYTNRNQAELARALPDSGVAGGETC